jgi:hypothetical protein
MNDNTLLKNILYQQFTQSTNFLKIKYDITNYRKNEHICDENTCSEYSPHIKEGPCRQCYGTPHVSDKELLLLFLNKYKVGV